MSDKLPPGPRLSDLRGAVRGVLFDQFNFLVEIVQKFGGIVFVKAGPVKFCFVAGPDEVHEVLVKNYASLEKGPAFHIARTVLGNGLLTADGEAHLRQRRLCQPAFHTDRIDIYARTMIECADRACNEWQDGRTFDVFPEMSKLTLSIAARTLFNSPIESQADEVRIALTDVLHNWSWRQLPLGAVMQRMGVPYRGSRKLRRARERLDNVLNSIIDDRRATGHDGDDLLSMMIHAVDEQGDGKSMSNTELLDQSMTLMLAGHETIATTLSWLWYQVSQHPEVESKLHDEIDLVLDGRLPEPGDVERLVYTRQVFAETLRLYPALWAFGRRTTQDIQVGEYMIPANTNTLFSPFVSHRNPEYFPDPERFDPDRWAGDAEDHLPDMAYFPFGGGVRRCIGEGFAWVEGTLALAILAQKWRVKLVPGHPIALQRGFIIRPKYGVQVTLERRAGRTVQQPLEAGLPT